jgi:acyl-CoA thioester hydrolase
MAVEIETYRSAVYPWHCDTMGHMNTQFYTAIWDAASFQMLSKLSRFDELQAHKRGWADIKSTTEYRHEVRAGALVHVRSSLTKVGNTSIEYHHTLLNSESGELHATCDIVTVLFDMAARKAMPLDAAIRAKAKGLGVG